MKAYFVPDPLFKFSEQPFRVDIITSCVLFLFPTHQSRDEQMDTERETQPLPQSFTLVDEGTRNSSPTQTLSIIPVFQHISSKTVSLKTPYKGELKDSSFVGLLPECSAEMRHAFMVLCEART